MTGGHRADNERHLALPGEPSGAAHLGEHAPMPRPARVVTVAGHGDSRREQISIEEEKGMELIGHIIAGVAFFFIYAVGAAFLTFGFAMGARDSRAQYIWAGICLAICAVAAWYTAVQI